MFLNFFQLYTRQYTVFSKIFLVKSTERYSVLLLHSKTKNLFFHIYFSAFFDIMLFKQFFWTLNFFILQFIPANLTLFKYGKKKFLFKLISFFLLIYEPLKFDKTLIKYLILTYFSKFMMEFFKLLIRRLRFTYIFFHYKTNFGFTKLKKKRRLKKKIKKKMHFYLQY